MYGHTVSTCVHRIFGSALFRMQCKQMGPQVQSPCVRRCSGRIIRATPNSRYFGCIAIPLAFNHRSESSEPGPDGLANRPRTSVAVTAEATALQPTEDKWIARTIAPFHGMNVPARCGRPASYHDGQILMHSPMPPCVMRHQCSCSAWRPFCSGCPAFHAHA